jgi:CubicO group peptidase (beta-lactamase class C family)
MSINSKQIVVFVLSVLLFQVISFSQQNNNKLFEEYLNYYVVNKNVPSIAAGIYKDGQIKWIGVSGAGDVENNLPATKASIYRIASITKPITAVAVLQLWERGLIDLDKDARIYIPNFPEKKWKFSVRQLLNHTAGIRSYKDGEFHNKKYYSSTQEAVKVFAYDSLDFEPGSKYEYTSLAYSLLAAIVENVSKMSFENYLNQNIFKPAEMNSTCVDKQKEIIHNRVKGYEKDFKRKIVNAPLADLSIKIAGGGLLSNSEDLLLFSKALLEGKLLKESTLKSLYHPTILKSGQKVNYSLGFALEFDGDSLKAISHTGGGTGFSTKLSIYPRINMASVHLINISDHNLDSPSDDLVKIELTGEKVFPTKTISDELMNIYLKNGIDSAVVRFEQIFQIESHIFTISEQEAIYFSRDLLGLNKTPEAIIYLKELLKKYPKSLDVLSTLADAYYKDNNRGLALRYYRMAAQINSNDKKVNEMIKKLSGK